MKRPVELIAKDERDRAPLVRAEEGLRDVNDGELDRIVKIVAPADEEREACRDAVRVAIYDISEDSFLRPFHPEDMSVDDLAKFAAEVAERITTADRRVLKRLAASLQRATLRLKLELVAAHDLLQPLLRKPIKVIDAVLTMPARKGPSPDPRLLHAADCAVDIMRRFSTLPNRLAIGGQRPARRDRPHRKATPLCKLAAALYGADTPMEHWCRQAVKRAKPSTEKSIV